MLVDVELGVRLARVAIIPLELQLQWGAETEFYISLVEQAAVILGLIEFASWFRGRDAYWFEDNSVVLAGMVKGASSGELLDHGAASAHLLIADMRARVWWEYVQSKANWSDGASRELEHDQWVRLRGFSTERAQIPLWPWQATGADRIAAVRKVSGERAAMGD